MEVRIGRTGVAILAGLLLVLLAEDVLVWFETGTVAAFEFLVVSLAVVVLFYVVIRQARSRGPRRP